jgi:hypothetical protein
MKSKSLTLIWLVILAVFSRLIPHPWNLTAVGSVAIFAGAYLRPRFLAFVIPVLAFFLSDLILGLHDTVFFTYGAILICAGLGLRFLKNPSAGSVVTLSLISSLVFFAVSNFGVWWAQDIYPHNAQGLLTCFIMGLPFFRGQILGDLLYSGVLFGAYAWLAQKAQQTA